VVISHIPKNVITEKYRREKESFVDSTIDGFDVKISAKVNRNKRKRTVITEGSEMSDVTPRLPRRVFRPLFRGKGKVLILN
jgi:hypothetical protein